MGPHFPLTGSLWGQLSEKQNKTKETNTQSNKQKTQPERSFVLSCSSKSHDGITGGRLENNLQMVTQIPTCCVHTPGMLDGVLIQDREDKRSDREQVCSEERLNRSGATGLEEDHGCRGNKRATPEPFWYNYLVMGFKPGGFVS